MSSPGNTPGPVARSAFRIGMIAAAILGLAGIGVLWWTSVLNTLLAGYLLVLVFPWYLVLAASAINTWLGYGKDATDLRRVYRPRDQ